MSSSDPKFQLRLRDSSEEAKTPGIDKPIKQEAFFDNLLQSDKNRCQSFKTAGRSINNFISNHSSSLKKTNNLFATTEESKAVLDS
mmetsp:Transcript_5881/g.9525  ORF Transcript_5881/g.9525 Transcript_5881/m.9525 type:complete len:86 (+) Transcript_5881:3797-4054(+)